MCPGRRTVTGLLSTSGAAFRDWSSAYRVFSAERVSITALFAGIRDQACAPGAELLAVLDDTLLPKRGAKTPGVAWRRDPLGPAFQVNLIRAQRFLQISMLPSAHPGLRTLVPVDFVHAPGVAKLPAGASPEQARAHAQRRRALSLTQVAVERLHHLRRALDAQQRSQPLLVAVDGGYTNRTVFGHVPERTHLVGRLRRDAKLFYPPPTAAPGRGRPRRYGAPAPTPDQLRLDDSVAWSSITLAHHGQPWTLRYKRLAPVLWRKTGVAAPVQMLVLAPTPYRPHARAKLCYRQPAYLVCTDPALPPERVIAAYLQRWSIEGNFRDEKTMLGVGEAQVRNPRSVALVPAFAVACYSLLLLASARAFPNPAALWPQPKWRRGKPTTFSVSSALAQLRAETWGRALGCENFPHFATDPAALANWQKSLSPPASALLYASH